MHKSQTRVYILVVEWLTRWLNGVADLVTNAAYKAQFQAMERLFEFKAKILKQPTPLTVESQGALELIDRLMEVFSQFLFEVDPTFVTGI